MRPLHVQVRVLRDGELLLARDVPPGQPLTIGPAGTDLIPTISLCASIALLVPQREGYGLRLAAPLDGQISVGGRTLRVVGGLLADPRPEPLLLADGDHGELALDRDLRLCFTVERLARGLRFRPRVEPRLAVCLSATAVVAALAVVVVSRSSPEPRSRTREVRLQTRPAMLSLRRLRGPVPAPNTVPRATSRRVSLAPFKRRAPVRPEDAILSRGVLGLLRRDPRSRGVARLPADPTRRALAALDETLASVATGERSRGSSGEGKADPLLAWLGGGSGKHGGHGLALPTLAPRLKDSRMTPATVGDVTPRGPGREEIRKVVAANAAAIRICYERALITSSRLGEGQLLVQWEINAGGRVIRAAVTRDSIGDAGLRSCVLAHVRSWSFPSCQRGCRIVYPFEFYTRS